MHKKISLHSHNRPVLFAFLLFFLTFIYTNKPKTTMSADQKSTGLNVISFLIPLVGLIIYLTQKDTHPIKATSAGKSALWGVGVGVVFYIISMVMLGAAIASI
jgi:hypothetical protein